MAPKLTTPPAAEPVTLAEAIAHLRADTGVEDALITRLITAARMECELRLNRTLVTSGWTLTLDGFPTALELPMPTLIAVGSIKYIDTDGVEQTLPSTEYTVDTAHEPGYVVPAFLKSWPDTRDHINTVTVVYTAGYGTAADVPAPIKQWILLAVGDMYDKRSRSNDARYPAIPMKFADGLIDVFKVWSL